MQLTYQQAYDKIIEAYFKDEIQPYSGTFCFCGTLCDNDSDWWGMAILQNLPYNNYRGHELYSMEDALLVTIMNLTQKGEDKYYSLMDGARTAIVTHPNYENALFAGMSAALDVLKEIHRSRGEDVDNISKPFTKRQLV